jgi:hypothetical protein
MNTLSSAYRLQLESVLEENGRVFNDAVKAVLTEATKDMTNQLTADAESVLSSVKKIRSTLSTTLSQINKQNNEVVTKYEPLIRQLDASRSAYTVRSYNLSNLATSDILARVMSCVANDLNLDPKRMTEPTATLEQLIADYNKMGQDAVHCLKRAVLGVANTVDVSQNFFQMVTDALVSPTATETRSFTNDTFGTLANMTDDFQASEMDAVVAELENHINEIRDLKRINLSSTGNEYGNSVMVQYLITRKMAICTALSLVAEVLNTKASVYEQMSVDYRKIIINTYEKLIAPAGGFVQEAYDPQSDDLIGLFHMECASSSDLF